MVKMHTWVFYVVVAIIFGLGIGFGIAHQGRNGHFVLLDGRRYVQILEKGECVYYLLGEKIPKPVKVCIIKVEKEK